MVAFPLAVLARRLWPSSRECCSKAAVPDLRVLTVGTDQNLVFVSRLVVLAVAIFSGAYQPLLRRVGADNLALGALAWWVLLALTFGLVSPSAA